MKKTIYISLFTTMSIYLFAQTNTMQESMKRGKVVYDKVCLSCHMVDGGGVPNMNPPLTVADYLKDKKKMISIVLKGMTDRIPIDDEYYSNNMAPHADLSNQQIADVLTYIRNSFGNKAGAVTVAEVAAVRTPLPAKKVFPKKKLNLVQLNCKFMDIMEIEVISVKAIEKYKIAAAFNDGTAGEYDLSHCAGMGVFKFWDEGDNFFKVFINPENNAIAWNELLEIDTLNCYLHIRGISFEDYVALNKAKQYAFS